jgi:MFS family permease
MALFSPLMGSIIDRKGTRQPFIAALIGYGLAGGSGLLINSYWVFWLAEPALESLLPV